MTQNQEITNLENKINQVQDLIDTQKAKLEKYQETILELSQQLNQIKQNTMKSINKNSPQDFKATK